MYIGRAVHYVREDLSPDVRELALRVRQRIRRALIDLRGQHRRTARRHSATLRPIVGADTAVDRSCIRRHSVLLARTEVLRDRILMVIVLSILVSLFAVPMLMLSFANGSIAKDLWIDNITFHEGDVPISIFVMILLLRIMFPPFPRQGYLHTLIGSRSFRRLWAGSVFISAVSGGVAALPYSAVLAWVLLAPCAVVVVVHFIAIIGMYCLDRIAIAYPEQYPLECLLRAHKQMVTSARRMDGITKRAIAASEIEAAAVHIVRVWPSQVRQLDGTARLWFETQCRQLVTHLENAKRRILWARSDASDAREETAAVIRAFVLGELAELATNPVPGIVESRRRAYFDDLRNVAIGFTPLVALGILRAVGLALPAPILPWTTFAAYVWALISLLFLIDPLLERRITMFGHLLDLTKPRPLT
jgi:hypothetical protein